MADTVRTSELPLEEGIPTGEELVEVSAINTENNISTFVSKKSTLANIGSWIFNHMSFSNLLTNNKTVVGAINEIKNNSGVISGPGAAVHNSIYRGKCLGTAPTNTQLQAIYNGSFDDLYIGDYWYNPVDRIHWRIAGFNYYYGTGGGTYPGESYVTTQHAVIIPDECIVGPSFIDQEGNTQLTQMNSAAGPSSYGGYLYSDMRGCKGATETFVIDHEPPSTGSETFYFNTQHIPSYGIELTGWMNIQNSQGVDVPALVKWNIDTYRSGEDPDNPGQGRIAASASRGYYVNFNILYTTSDVKPRIYYFPVGTEVTVSYKYYEEGYGALSKAKNIIENVFGAEHIMKIPQYLDCGYGVKSSQTNSKIYDFNESYVTVELPSAAHLFGNNSMTDCNTYRRTPGYRGNGVWSDYDYFRLPLFLYNPLLIHNGQSYWLRNIYTETEGSTVSGIPNTANHETRFLLVDSRGNQVADNTYGARVGTGIRPIFCISAISEPFEIQE